MDFVGHLDVARILLGTAEAIGFVVRRPATVFVEAHGAVAMISVDRALGLVDRQRFVVNAHPIAMRVGVAHDARLQHLVGRIAHAGNHVGRRERGLLHLGEVVLRIAVQLHHGDFLHRILLVRPDLGQVKRIE